MTRSDQRATLPSAALPVPRFVGFRTVLALILREMNSTYGRSPGGYAWAVIEPIGAILTLSIGFSMVMRNPSLGTSFLLYYATGYLPFGMWGSSQTKSSSAIQYSRPMLAYPRVTWIDAILSRFLLNVLTETVVLCLVIGGIVLFESTGAELDILPVLEALSLAALIGLGVGLLNSVLGAYFTIWPQIWGIFSRPLFLASGIFFLYEHLPPIAQAILWWNPLLHITGIFRTGFYPTYNPDYVSHVFVWALTLSLLALGLVLMRAHHKTVLER